MKKFKICFFIIFILVLTTGFEVRDDWYLLKSDGFQIEFPKEPVSQPQMTNSEIGELKINLFICDESENKNDSNLVYLTGSTVYPDSIVKIINSDKTGVLNDFFRKSVDGTVTGSKGKLLSEKVIEIDNYPGREIKVDLMEGQAVIKMRLYLVKNKLYIIEIITETSKVPNTSIDRFIDSFKLI